MAEPQSTAPKIASLDKLRSEITADNALKLLAGVPCPCCTAVGWLATFHEIGNNGIGLVCKFCDSHHPFAGVQILWLRQDDKPKRSNDIVAVVRDRGNYCYFCGAFLPDLLKRGIGAHVHHSRPFHEHGERYDKIPVCSECHELASFMQRMRKRQSEWQK